MRKLTMVSLMHSCRCRCSSLQSMFMVLDCDANGEVLSTDYNREKLARAQREHDSQPKNW